MQKGLLLLGRCYLQTVKKRLSSNSRFRQSGHLTKGIKVPFYMCVLIYPHKQSRLFKQKRSHMLVLQGELTIISHFIAILKLPVEGNLYSS